MDLFPAKAVHNYIEVIYIFLNICCCWECWLGWGLNLGVLALILSTCIFRKYGDLRKIWWLEPPPPSPGLPLNLNLPIEPPLRNQHRIPSCVCVERGKCKSMSHQIPHNASIALLGFEPEPA